ncbi:MAG: serine/threonine protein kinase [Planctomycetes bacterium]|nr:serine/threonine protein kinase [Planctomycetota bacterium]
MGAGGAERAIPVQVGRYLVRSTLGAGGMGVVLRAHDPALGRDVAVKLLRPGSDASPKALARFQREARALGRLRHPGIVRVLDADEHEGHPFFVMELIEGESLEDRLQRAGHLPLADALRMGEDLARALHHAHGEGVLHRDVKPGNVLLCADGTALLADFGLAKDLAAASRFSLTAEGATLGTLGFMPPEQFEDARSADVRSDVFSLGATVYAALSGRPPFPATAVRDYYMAMVHGRWPRPTSLRPELPAGVDAVCEGCLAARGVDRYATARDLAEDWPGCDGASRPWPDRDRPARRAARSSRWARSWQRPSATPPPRAGRRAWRP